MTIARVFDGKGWTQQQYDELMAKLVADLGLKPGRSAPGVLFHWAAATDDGMRAVDVYESREAADRLVQNNIGPIAASLGLPLPDIAEFEVHNLLTHSCVERPRRHTSWAGLVVADLDVISHPSLGAALKPARVRGSRVEQAGDQTARVANLRTGRFGRARSRHRGAGRAHRAMRMSTAEPLGRGLDVHDEH